MAIDTSNVVAESQRETKHSRPGISLIAGDVTLILKEWNKYLENLGVSVAGWFEERNGALVTPSGGPDLPLAAIALPVRG